MITLTQGDQKALSRLTDPLTRSPGSLSEVPQMVCNGGLTSKPGCSVRKTSVVSMIMAYERYKNPHRAIL